MRNCETIKKNVLVLKNVWNVDIILNDHENCGHHCLATIDEEAKKEKEVFVVLNRFMCLIATIKTKKKEPKISST